MLYNPDNLHNQQDNWHDVLYNYCNHQNNQTTSIMYWKTLTTFTTTTQAA